MVGIHHQVATIRYELILCLMSNMMDDTRQGLLAVVISPMFPTESVYSGVVCLYEESGMVTFLS